MSQTETNDLPFVHDLTPASLRSLQAEVATQHGLATYFRDALKGGGEGPELAVIPAGLFEMGTRENEREFGDLPQRNMPIEQAFAIGRYTVTADEFECFAQASGFVWQEHLTRSEGRHPVVNVSPADAQAYLDWLSAETGQRYRLPSEAEWEYAARAGSRTPYCFGDRLTCGEGNVGGINTGTRPVGGWRRFLPFCAPLGQTVEVGTFPANVWGLFEVHGNVWEFTSDVWTGAVDALNTAGLNTDRKWRVTKGGSWFEGAAYARAAARKPRYHDELDVNLGLRVVREIPLKR